MLKPIPNFEKYSINTLGEVFSYYKYKHGKKLKPHLSNGYYMITLYRDKKQYYSTIHRLLGLIFIDNPENKPCIDHINRIRTDNRLDNLRWVTYSENNQNKETSTGCISKRPHGSYLFIIQINGVLNSRTLKTLEEAEHYQYLFNNNLELPKKIKGCIYQKKNGSYRFIIQIEGKTHTRQFKTLEEAKTYQQTFQDKDLELPPKKLKGCIYQRKIGSYQFRIQIEGKTQTKTFKTLEEAKTYQQTFQ